MKIFKDVLKVGLEQLPNDGLERIVRAKRILCTGAVYNKYITFGGPMFVALPGVMKIAIKRKQLTFDQAIKAYTDNPKFDTNPVLFNSYDKALAISSPGEIKRVALSILQERSERGKY